MARGRTPKKPATPPTPAKTVPAPKTAKAAPAPVKVAPALKAAKTAPAPKAAKAPPATPAPKSSPKAAKTTPAPKASSAPKSKAAKAAKATAAPNGKSKKPAGPLINVRHMTRRDIGSAWEFLKISFRAVNAETVEYQRPISRRRFEEVFEEEGIEQLLFEVDDEIVAYAECSYEVTGSDNWINPRYFEKRDMRPLFVDELAVHPNWNGKGVGSFVLEQLHHLARVHGLNHLVLEVAENNERALEWYKKRAFKKLDAAIFMACSVEIEPELLPPRALPAKGEPKPAESEQTED